MAKIKAETFSVLPCIFVPELATYSYTGKIIIITLYCKLDIDLCFAARIHWHEILQYFVAVRKQFSNLFAKIKINS